MLNSMNIVGRPTTDPELRYTPSGIAVTTLIVAVQRNFKNDQGEYEADFVKVVVWKEGAEYTANYARKGKLLSVDGRFQSGSYDNAEGIRVFTFELHANNVSVIEWTNNDDDNGNSSNQSQSGGGGSNNTNNRGNNAGNGNSNKSQNNAGNNGNTNNRSQGNRSGNK